MTAPAAPAVQDVIVNCVWVLRAGTDCETLWEGLNPALGGRPMQFRTPSGIEIQLYVHPQPVKFQGYIEYQPVAASHKGDKYLFGICDLESAAEYGLCEGVLP